MKRIKSHCLQLMLFIVLSCGAAAQESQIDSLEHQRRITEITKRLEERNIKLSKLETALLEGTQTQEKAAKEAKESADENKDAAIKLSNDAESRKKAKKAERSSDQARRDSKRARRAAKNLGELRDDIDRAKRLIAEDEKTLAELVTPTDTK